MTGKPGGQKNARGRKLAGACSELSECRRHGSPFQPGDGGRFMAEQAGNDNSYNVIPETARQRPEQTLSARPGESGDPGQQILEFVVLDSRLRGNERSF
jgi:hypothetical protein